MLVSALTCFSSGLPLEPRTLLMRPSRRRAVGGHVRGAWSEEGGGIEVPTRGAASFGKTKRRVGRREEGRMEKMARRGRGRRTRGGKGGRGRRMQRKGPNGFVYGREASRSRPLDSLFGERVEDASDKGGGVLSLASRDPADHAERVHVAVGAPQRRGEQTAVEELMLGDGRRVDQRGRREGARAPLARRVVGFPRCGRE